MPECRKGEGKKIGQELDQEVNLRDEDGPGQLSSATLEAEGFQTPSCGSQVRNFPSAFS